MHRDGHAAILGIDGGKSGVEAFDGPMIKLKAIRDQKGMEEAYFDMILTKMHNFKYSSTMEFDL